MNIPIEVWAHILSYLELNDLFEVSCICKDFYCLSRINSFYVKKLNQSRQVFRNRSQIFPPSAVFVIHFTADCSENYCLMSLWMTF